MPRSEDIERFTQVLNSLGDEPAIRAARSETIEQVLPPGEEPEWEEAGLSESFSAEAAGDEQESLQDLFAGLSGLPDEEPAAGAPSVEEPTPEEPTAEERDATGEGLDFESLLGEESEPQAIEDLEAPAPKKPARGRKASRAEPPSEEPVPEEERFDFTEGEPAELQSDVSQMEVLPEDSGPPAEAPAEQPFEDLDSLSLDTSEGEGLSLPSLDGVSFAEPTEAAALSAPEPAPEASQEIRALEDIDLDAVTGFEPPPEEPEADGAEEAAAGSEPSGAEPFAAAPEMESLGEEALGDINLDEFPLPDSAEQFGVPAAPPASRKPVREQRARAAPREPEPVRRAPGPPELAAAAGEVQLTPEQFVRLKKTLQSLPRNLKIVVQDLIGEGAVKGPDLSKLISLLIAGASAQEIATLAGRISGKRIRIPAGYEKKSGVAFEAEQRTFAYAFRENILPLLRVVVVTVLAGAILAFFGYRYVYRPLNALANYRAGYAQIRNDRFTLANERFARGSRMWQIKNWYHRYAEAFADKRQYVLAEEKYDLLLRDFPGDRKGVLDYARMESTRLADYEKADKLLQTILDRKRYDYDALLAAGDNAMEWADRVEAKYEAARLAYATLIERYGAKDELLFRMMRYFIRRDIGEEVERLRLYFASRPDIKVNPEVYAELGGYLVDHRRLDYVKEVLFHADKVRPNMPEVHYNLARYYNIVASLPDEKLALDAVVKLLQKTDPLTRKRLALEIDTHTRLGEYYYHTKEYIAAEKELQFATRLVDQNQRMRLIDRDRLFGRPFAALGDLSYYIQGDLAAAGIQYQSAIANFYTDPELTYKIGYIRYAGQDYRGALASFTSAEEASGYPSGIEPRAPVAVQVPLTLLYALGNSFFQRGDYFAAQGFYQRLLSRLETKRAALGTLLPEERPEDRALLDNLVKVNNNLGVTMIRLSERTGDRRKRSEALVSLTAAAQIADSLARSPATAQRSETRGLPYLNMRGILYPVTGFVLQIYATLPKDFKDIRL